MKFPQCHFWRFPSVKMRGFQWQKRNWAASRNPANPGTCSELHPAELPSYILLWEGRDVA
jgi:hypothetical protein